MKNHSYKEWNSYKELKRYREEWDECIEVFHSAVKNKWFDDGAHREIAITKMIDTIRIMNVEYTERISLFNRDCLAWFEKQKKS